MKNVTNYWPKKYERANKRAKKYKDLFETTCDLKNIREKYWLNEYEILSDYLFDSMGYIQEINKQINRWRVVVILLAIALLLKLIL